MKIATIVLTGIVSLFCWSEAEAMTNLFITHFETNEGYDPAYELIGQQGWVSDTTSTGGNGLFSPFLGTQAAYVGYFALEPAAEYLDVWQPLNFAPLSAGQPIIKFYTTMAIMDSSNGEYDDFYWSVYNVQGQRLFTLDFNNYDTNIYYVLDGTNNFVNTGRTFVPNTTYSLTMTMDFLHNVWSANFGGQTLVTNLPITTVHAELTLGDVDAVWAVYYPNSPGDNYMAFDNFRVTAEPDLVQLVNFQRNASGQSSMRLIGSSGYRYAIDASVNLRQWTALRTNTISGGYFDFVDNSAAGLAARYYRARWVP